jgi:hypothetical protein
MCTRHTIYPINEEMRVRMHEMHLQAVAAGKGKVYVYYLQEVITKLQDTRECHKVGRLLRYTEHPGGCARELRIGCFLLRYVIYSDDCKGFIYSFEFRPRDWA